MTAGRDDLMLFLPELVLAPNNISRDAMGVISWLGGLYKLQPHEMGVQYYRHTETQCEAS